MKKNKKFFHARVISPATGQSQWTWINVDHISKISDAYDNKDLTLVSLASSARVFLNKRDTERLYKFLGLK